MHDLFKFFNPILLMHIISGTIALGIFIIPLICAKGSMLHRIFGQVYMAAMAFVSFSAAGLCYLRLINFNSTAIQKQFSYFLLFISIFTCATSWYALRVLRYKYELTTHKQLLDYVIAILLVVSGILMIIYGYFINNTLYTYFPLIGVGLGIAQMSYWWNNDKKPKQWWLEHMTGTFSSCIGTITAFSVLVVAKRVSGEYQLLVWIFPSLILVPILIKWKKHYQKKFNFKN